MTSRSARARTAVRAGLALTLAVLLTFAVDVVLTSGHSARGASVAGMDLSDLDRGEVRERVARLAASGREPVRLHTTSGAATLAASELGLTFDSTATVERAMTQPRNPLTRLLAIFGRTTQVDPVVSVDRQKLTAALDNRRGELERAAVEGGVHFATSGGATTAVGDLPSAGQRIDRDAVADVLAANWLRADVVDLPMVSFSPTVSAATVGQTVDGPARTYVSGPVKLAGRGVEAALAPEQLGTISVFAPDGRGGLRPVVDPEKLAAVAGPMLRRSEKRAVEATFDLAGGRPSVVPSRDGQVVDWPATAQRVAAAAAGQQRRADVAYRPVKPKLTTDRARKLGVREVISEFTTTGFSGPSGENIRLVAQEVDGAVVAPGKKFSLNGHTGPRGKAQGYVDSTVIDHGRPDTAVGGGISQFATTLYNASYFAGLEDVTHTEHSYYISRYPEAREATVYEGAIDLSFRNNTSTGVYIETQWTPSSVTVRLWGTKTVDVKSVTGERFAFTDPPKVELPKGDSCIASSGHRGFTTSDTRIITDAASGAETYRHTRTVKYDPEPQVVCV